MLSTLWLFFFVLFFSLFLLSFFICHFSLFFFLPFLFTLYLIFHKLHNFFAFPVHSSFSSFFIPLFLDFTRFSCFSHMSVLALLFSSFFIYLFTFLISQHHFFSFPFNPSFLPSSSYFPFKSFCPSPTPKKSFSFFNVFSDTCTRFLHEQAKHSGTLISSVALVPV